MAEEIEIKLAVPPERAGEVRRLELLRGLAEKRGSTRQLSTVYFDTPEQALAKRGIALRIRSAGRRKLQTIKLPAEGPGGLQIQREVETPVARLIVAGKLRDGGTVRVDVAGDELRVEAQP